MPADATARLRQAPSVIAARDCAVPARSRAGTVRRQATYAVFKKKFTMIKCCKDFVYSISGNSVAFMKFKYAEIFQYRVCLSCTRLHKNWEYCARQVTNWRIG